MIHILNEDFKSEKTDELISTCKSNSGVMGGRLRKVHYDLGRILTQNYKNHFSEQCCIVSFLRSALPFSFGVADILDCPILFYDSNNHDFFDKNKDVINDKQMLFVDAVINSGRGMLETIGKLKVSHQKIKIITNVLCDKALEIFADYDVFTVRVSHNSFKGAKVLKQVDDKGPDTGDRLFRSLFE
ncbi:MAG: uracil phosphoribosyltransferase [Spirochaetales bacterium]|nr:uracil phosphoribosyltransferase [Spirochaetales bacterium]